jgi:hypothetical protein
VEDRIVGSEPEPDGEFLTAADILGASDEEIRIVEVPEWGGKKIRMRTLTAGESGEFMSLASDKAKQGEAPLYILMMSLVDEAGRRLFKKADIETLKKRSLKVVMRIQDIAMDLNGLTDKAKEAAKNA